MATPHQECWDWARAGAASGPAASDGSGNVSTFHIPRREEEGSGSGGSAAAAAAYLQELLADEDTSTEIHTLDDLVAYQVIHNELAGMIACVSDSLESCASFETGGGVPAAAAAAAAAAAGRPNPEVEAWVASFLNNTGGSPGGGGCGSPAAAVAAQVQPPPKEPGEEDGAARQAESSEGESKLMSLEEVTDMLVECGEAVVADDVDLATALVRQIRRFARPDGCPVQRVAHYFVEAVVCKLDGTASVLYTTLMKRDKQALYTAEREYMRKEPTMPVCLEFSKRVLLDAFQGARAVHIVDYGILGHHAQWESLVRALAYRPEGPPRLRITGIEYPQPGAHPDGAVKQTGRKLARLTAAMGVPFEYRGFAGKWEDVQVAHLELRDDEVLAVASVFRMRHLVDDSVVVSNPRKTVLERICSMRPKVFVMADRSLAANAPFLTARLRHAVPSWFSFFDFLDAVMPRDCPTRRLLEHDSFGFKILNTIGCEGADRRERPEAYYQWHRRLVNAGFEQLPLTEKTLECARDVMHDYHRDWGLGQDEGWILTGWKNRIHHAFSAWRPRTYA